MSNFFGKLLRFFWAENTFDQLPKDAPLNKICGYAGRVLRAQVENDKRTDWKNPKHFNEAIWYLAEKATERGFTELRGMTTRQIASEMGASISGYIRSQQKPPIPPREQGYGSSW